MILGLEDETALDAEEVFDALHAKRMEWVGDGHPRERPFAWTVLGGRWTAAHRGVAFDAFQGKTMSSDARTFVGMFMMQQTCRWSLSLYGEYACSVLATCWVSKMTYLFELWVDAGSSGAWKCTVEQLGAFSEPLEFTALAAGASGRLMQRITELRTLAPNCGARVGSSDDP